MIALWISLRDPSRHRTPARKLLEGSEKSLVFIFDDESLIDATIPAQALLKTVPHAKTDWQRLSAVLCARFPTLKSDLTDLAQSGRKTLIAEGADDPTIIVAEWWDDLVRIELLNPEETTPEIPVDRECLTAMEAELSLLRAAAENAPFLLWQQTKDGDVTWANTAYIDRANQLRPDTEHASWPPPRLFDPLNAQEGTPRPGTQRMAMRTPDGKIAAWFDCKSVAFGDLTLNFAIDADTAVQAELAQRDFVQTLTKTFAHLHVGLAIFNERRQLTLFNPALTDLTGLPVDFLSSKPTLRAVLDRLRDKRMLPEPKDYKSWRQHMAALEAAAVDGTYEETWSLSSGRTYRVTGRPHPNGAIAFQFEDITSEISLTRKFRSELELGQAVIDSQPEAVAVFSCGGPLSLSNDAYARLWGVDPGSAIAETTSADALRQWSAACAPTPVWDRIAQFIDRRTGREAWDTTVTLLTGAGVTVRLVPLPGGATLVGFTPEANIPAAQNEKEGAPETVDA
ncbi:PAS-domain containing protein [Aliiroseovarius sp. YM-037]